MPGGAAAGRKRRQPGSRRLPRSFGPDLAPNSRTPPRLHRSFLPVSCDALEIGASGRFPIFRPSSHYMTAMYDSPGFVSVGGPKVFGEPRTDMNSLRSEEH